MRNAIAILTIALAGCGSLFGGRTAKDEAARQACYATAELEWTRAADERCPAVPGKRFEDCEHFDALALELQSRQEQCP